MPAIYEQYKKRRDSKEARDELNNWVNERAKDKNGRLKIVNPEVPKSMKPVPESEKFTIHKQVLIVAMGLFDTVGSLGIPAGTMSTLTKPLRLFGIGGEKYQYHDTSFPTESGKLVATTLQLE